MTVGTICATFLVILVHLYGHIEGLEGLNWSRSVDSFGHAGPRLCRPRHAKAMICPVFQGQKLQSVASISLKIMRHTGHPNCWLLNKRIWETTNCVAHLRNDYVPSVRFHCTSTKSFFSPQRPSHRVTFVFRCSRLVMVMRSSMMGDPHQQNTSGGFNPPEQ